MNNKTYKITIFKNSLSVWLGLVVIVVLTILPILKLNDNPIVYGVSSLFFGVILFLLIKQLIASFNNFLLITEQGLELKNPNSKQMFTWSEISEFGLQTLVSRTMGIAEGVPFLGVSFTEQSKYKLDNFDSSKSVGLFKLKNDLTDYMGEPKHDLYISLRLLSEKDADLMSLLTKQASFTKKNNPLVKTKNPDEYNKIIAENFKLQE